VTVDWVVKERSIPVISDALVEPDRPSIFKASLYHRTRKLHMVLFADPEIPNNMGSFIA
jgi:hypothetical protein